ncbi:type II secretion system F family protein [Pectobacterium odoriferum]|uniref:Secretion system protein n=1 Tax=Pectobacterium odoriferum TaxID=78398 RepID=A0ABR4VPR5_9GAMM|nr:type II secretion system F family protein [Pectobacterium odoriferum]AIU86949.1 secretion system protein [Pectobacterium odoriferum]KGA32974.1 secretion system protein [Pectobacterium odoriferum]KGA41352.1 secretion system protein [Pectobacterium odoriferum]MBA0188850.1 type II secretion system F family protein [Pectobacterium odoriferum]POD91191.1 secretion system protein [Pectobacterium odoriferum]
MNATFYGFLLLTGIFIFSVALFKYWIFAKRRDSVETKDVGNKQGAQPILDYRRIIIDNSPLMIFFQRIEDNLTIKLRLWGGCGVLLFVAQQLGILPVGSQGLAMIMMLILILVVVMPAMLVGSMVKTKVKLMLDALPYFVDLTAVCVQAGMTVESSIKFVSERSGDLDENLSSLMRHLIKRAEVSGLEEALLELYRAMDMTEMRMFCSSLQQSVHYGTSLYEGLIDLSKDIRDLQLLESEEKIGSLSAKMSVPLIIFIMFPITILIAAPGILRIMKNAIF